MKTALSVVILSLFISNSYASVVRVGIIDFPPLYRYEGDKKSGILTSLLRRVLEKAGVQYEMKGHPVTELYRNLKSGRTNVFIGAVGSPVYSGHVLYSKYPCLSIELRLYANGGTDIPESISGVSGKTVGAIRGYSYGKIGSFIRDPKNRVSVTYDQGHELVFDLLQNKKVQYVLDYTRPSERALETVKIPNIHSKVITKLKLYIIVSKKTENAKKLMESLESAYHELMAERSSL